MFSVVFGCGGVYGHAADRILCSSCGLGETIGHEFSCRTLGYMRAPIPAFGSVAGTGLRVHGDSISPFRVKEIV
jgi:hypothetical protein